MENYEINDADDAERDIIPSGGGDNKNLTNRNSFNLSINIRPEGDVLVCNRHV